MREIKFRAWDKSKSIMFDEIESTYDWEFMPMKTCEDDYYVLMQYTGLKDKNGVEIYEGDIVKHKMRYTWDGKGDVTIGWIKYVDVSVSFRTVSKNGFEEPIHEGIELEVIGNICENKELLNDTRSN